MIMDNRNIKIFQCKVFRTMTNEVCFYSQRVKCKLEIDEDSKILHSIEDVEENIDSFFKDRKEGVVHLEVYMLQKLELNEELNRYVYVDSNIFVINTSHVTLLDFDEPKEMALNRNIKHLLQEDDVIQINSLNITKEIILNFLKNKSLLGE